MGISEATCFSTPIALSLTAVLAAPGSVRRGRTDSIDLCQTDLLEPGSGCHAAALPNPDSFIPLTYSLWQGCSRSEHKETGSRQGGRDRAEERRKPLRDLSASRSPEPFCCTGKRVPSPPFIPGVSGAAVPPPLLQLSSAQLCSTRKVLWGEERPAEPRPAIGPLKPSPYVSRHCHGIAFTPLPLRSYCSLPAMFSHALLSGSSFLPFSFPSCVSLSSCWFFFPFLFFSAQGFSASPCARQLHQLTSATPGNVVSCHSSDQRPLVKCGVINLGTPKTTKPMQSRS